MRFFEHNWMRIAAALAVGFVVSACGVKSSPGTPEGATYPRTYPPVSASGGQNANKAPRPSTRTLSPGTYQPPPPATQMPR